MRLHVRTNYHKFNSRISKEGFGGSVVLSVRIVCSDMNTSFHVDSVHRRPCSLEESIDVQVLVGLNERKMEALRREAIAHQANIDGRHRDSLDGFAVMIITKKT